MATTFKFEVYWNASWVDETAYLVRSRGRVGYAKRGDLVADVGRFDFYLDNTSERFSPGNTGGALYGHLLPRRQVRLSATDGVDTWVLYRGWIDRLIADGGEWSKAEVLLRCVDGMALLQNQRVTVDHAATKAVDEAVSDLVSAAYTPPATSYGDNGDSLTHYGRAWNPEETTVIQALRDVASAVYGRYYAALDGTATFVTRDEKQDASVGVTLTI